MSLARTIRKVHKWAGIAATLPLLVVALSGILLQFKKEVAWVQPPTGRGTGDSPVVSFERILHAASTVPEAGIAGWGDVDRLDVRPGKGLVKVRGKNGFEVQVDTLTGEILHAARRRSDTIEDIHDGSFFAEPAKLWIFFPAAALLVVLLASGVYIVVRPMLAKRR